MKVTSLIFASMVATAAAHPVSVACTDDDTATTMRVGGVMMGVTVAAAPSDGATLTVTKARVADVYYLHVDNIPTADFFAVRTQGNAGNLTSRDGNMTNTDSCSAQVYLPVPADPTAATPTKADIAYTAPAGLNAAPEFTLVYGSPAGLYAVTAAAPSDSRGKHQKQYLKH